MAAVKFTAANSNFDSDLRKPLHEEMMRWADAKRREFGDGVILEVCLANKR